jgi:hypothetical protein
MHRIADALGIGRVGHPVCPGGGSFSPPQSKSAVADLDQPLEAKPRLQPGLGGDGSGAKVTGWAGGAPSLRDPPPRPAPTREGAGAPYAVVHAAPMFVYKRWTGTAGEVRRASPIAA